MFSFYSLRVMNLNALSFSFLIITMFLPFIYCIILTFKTRWLHLNLQNWLISEFNLLCDT